MATSRDRDLDRLIPIQSKQIKDGIITNAAADGGSNSSASTVAPVVSGKEAFSKLVRSWAWKKFITGSVILLPIAITFCVTWWFIRFVDSFFSPIYALLGIDVWLGASVLSLGEWFINKMPFVSYIYSASKQISTAADQNSHAFKEVAIIRHPRNGEYAFGFITSTVLLRGNLTTEELCCVYVPTNHLYLGDIYLISSKDVMRPNLSVREGIDAEIVISGGMSIPQILTTLEEQEPDEAKLGKYGVPPV
ncbi:Protein LIKE COV 3 [Linum perenne]